MIFFFFSQKEFIEFTCNSLVINIYIYKIYIFFYAKNVFLIDGKVEQSIGMSAFQK